MVSSLELRLEAIKSLDNHQRQLFKAFYDKRSIAERYRDNSVVIHIHMLTTQNCLCYARVKFDNDGAVDDGEMAVLVWIGEFGKPFRPLASITRLQPLDSCDVFRGENGEMVSPERVLEYFFGVCNRKLCAIYDSLGIQAGKLINEILQGSPKVLYNVSDESANSQRGFNLGHGSPANRYFAPLPPYGGDAHLIIQGNAITYLLGKAPDQGLQSIQVFMCPIDPLISAIQRVHSRTISEDKPASQSEKGSNAP